MKISKDNSICLVVDIQEKLFPHMFKKEILVKNLVKLIKGLKLLNLEFILNEQYPKGLGKTIPQVKELLENEKINEKFTFSCYKNETVSQKLKNSNKKFVILFGIETHVCVLQTALDLIEENFIPVVVADCVSSRKESDKDFALQRLLQSGAILTTYESLLFELCETAKNPVFKEISKIVK